MSKIAASTWVCLLVILAILGLADFCLAITARPGSGTLLGTGSGPGYFKIRPNIVDVPESPAKTRPVGVCKALVILVDFPDKLVEQTIHTPEFFEQKLFDGQNSSSLKSYFRENSYERFSLEGGIVGWVRSDCRHRDIVNRDGLRGTQDDHGLDISGYALAPSICEFPLNVWGLVKHAVELAAARIDLRDFDNDGPDGIPHSGDDDGFIDALFIVHAGIGAEQLGDSPGSENYIWSLQSNLDYYAPTRETSIDSVRVGPFVIVPELSEIGVFAHEFCHLLGLPDLYNSLTGESVVGPLCLMDAGAWNGPQGRQGSRPCHLSTPMKYMLGWIDPQQVCLGCPGPDHVEGAEIRPLGDSRAAFSLLDNPGGMDWTPYGQGKGEYFILENRQTRHGYFESYLPASGMLIWKVDESRPNNNTAGQRLAEVIQADGGTVNSATGNPDIPGQPSDFWPGSLNKQEFTPYTDPSSNLSGGRFSGVAVESIEEKPLDVIQADIRIGLPQAGHVYAYPNPYSLDSLRAGRPLRVVFVPKIGPVKPFGFEVTIFDLEGNPLRRLDEQVGEVLGDGTALWDGKNESGRLVEPGLYLYSVRSSGEQATGVIAIKK
jgi:M6 family metalloprotease-like protein